ncbi:kynurenine 3-monooxygenase [Verticillium alfalfae VaMs.102]|uniref:Kynurenine 3-monooxygenase n=1 Tax=Verticillium alfalfae (strain VaMs.102 / ATCC MYA-4576 / FGSC 10136) TaxID=526221 RepID=C9SJ43_VERA1|nr:kynurenine 3-monooxygenase [Verticillium alfalfae VaMs.102]EEY18966.1 kynurenine 3-monooxygenase [Verticillium alfalfae VaMs.102]
MAATQTSIAIIGAGLSGLCLGLALHQQLIPCTIYESRTAPLDIGGAIMLSPNALRILDSLGVYERLAPLAYHFQNLHFRTDDDKLLDTFEFGSEEKYGFDGVRVYRFELIKVLLEKLSEGGIRPHYGKKFVKVTGEDSESVTWAFDDGSSEKASFLIGADGIHSRVRAHINANAIPIFTKMIGVSATIPTAQLGFRVDDDYPLPVTVMNKKHGAFVAAPQRKDGSEIFIGKQCHFTEEPDREGWERITSDKAWCIEFLRQGSEDYPPFVARAVSNIRVETINLWPFYIIPKLESWASSQGRVVILGDAAHAIPPTAGQGVNQAFEDVYVFAKIVGRVNQTADRNLRSVLHEWQLKRQERVDQVLELNASINKRRLPAKGDDIVSHEAFDLDWLYGVDFEATVQQLLVQHSH